MKLPPVFDGIRDVIIKKAMNVAVVLIFLFVAFLLVRAFLYSSDYFRLRAVEIRDTFLDRKSIIGINNYILSSCKGKNVFRLNLKSIDRYLAASYPDAKEIQVKLELPDKIVMTMKFRKPVAVANNGRLYAIDEDGFVLPNVNADLLKGLPVIEGAGLRYDDRRPARSSSANLKIALELLKAVKASKLMADCGVESINAQDPRSMSFTIRNGVEIRIGQEDFKERLETLESILKDPRLAMDKIKYIDVRFKDVVIGPK